MRWSGIALIAVSISLTGCGGGGGSSATVSVGSSTSVSTTNRSPVVALANIDQPAIVGTAFAYDASRNGTVFTDADGDSLSYTVALTPTGSGLTATGAAISGTPNAAGTVAVTITATDGRGGSATNSFNILVQAVTAAALGRPTLPATIFRYADADIALPLQFRNPGPGNIAGTDNTPATNPTTNAGATLGRVLFYDKRLSLNDTIACASCHQQARGFADSARLSVGFRGGLTGRHSMGLANARYYGRGRFFWDERAATLEEQVLTPIQDTTEMGMTLAGLETKLAATDFYPALFVSAFGTTQVTRDRISLALAQYVRSISSYQTKYDRAFTNGVANFAGTFTAQEERGRQIFEGPARCNVCHATDAHVSNNIHNNGLDATVTDVGAGQGRFKAPSLRNVAVRAPFMHDGRFATLRQVVDHYDSGVQFSANLDPVLVAGGGARRLNLSEADKQALEAFMGTLTDTTLMADPKFSTPFTN